METNDAKFIDEMCTILQKNDALKKQDSEALKIAFQNRSDLIFEEFLLHEGLISKEQLLTALSEYFNVPAVDVLGLFFDHHLVKMFPLDVMLRYHFIPYEQDELTLSVIAANPNDPELPEVIGRYVSYDLVFYVGYVIDINDMAEDFYDESLREEREELSIDEEAELTKEADAWGTILEEADVELEKKDSNDDDEAL